MSTQSPRHTCENDSKSPSPPDEISPLLRGGEKSCPYTIIAAAEDLSTPTPTPTSPSPSQQEDAPSYYIYTETLYLWLFAVLFQIFIFRDAPTRLDRLGPALLTSHVGIFDMLMISHAVYRQAPFLLLIWWVGVVSGFILLFKVDVVGVPSLARYVAAVAWLVAVSLVIVVAGCVMFPRRRGGAGEEKDLEAGDAFLEKGAVAVGFEETSVRGVSYQSFEPRRLVPGDMHRREEDGDS